MLLYLDETNNNFTYIKDGFIKTSQLPKLGSYVYTDNESDIKSFDGRNVCKDYSQPYDKFTLVNFFNQEIYNTLEKVPTAFIYAQFNKDNIIQTIYSYVNKKLRVYTLTEQNFNNSVQYSIANNKVNDFMTYVFDDIQTLYREFYKNQLLGCPVQMVISDNFDLIQKDLNLFNPNRRNRVKHVLLNYKHICESFDNFKDIRNSDFFIKYHKRHVSKMRKLNCISKQKNALHSVFGAIHFESKHKILLKSSFIVSFTKTPFNKLSSLMNCIENYLLCEISNLGYVVPRLFKKPKRQTYTSTKVFLHKKGVYNNILYLDFSSMNPNIIRSLNIMVSNECPNVLTDMIDKFITLRSKPLLSSIMKKLLVIVYGSFGNNNYRFYDINKAKAINEFSVKLNKFTRNLLNKLYKHDENRVIYSDTDSFFIRTDDINTNDIDTYYTTKILPSINKYINGFCNKLGVKNFFDLKIDNFFDRIIILGKRKYIGIRNGKLIKSGFNKDYNIATKTKDFIDKVSIEVLNGTDIFNIRDMVHSYYVFYKSCDPNEILPNISTTQKYKNYVIDDSYDVVLKQNSPSHIVGCAYHNYKLTQSDIPNIKLRYAPINEITNIKSYTDIDGNPFSFISGWYPIEFAPKMDTKKHFFDNVVNPINSVLSTTFNKRIDRQFKIVT